MAEGEPIGGFFASLKLDSDEASFAKGERALTSLANAVKAFISVEAIKGFAEFVTKLDDLQAKMNDTAAAAGINTDELDRWGIVMRTVGESTEDFTSHLRDLKNLSADLAQGLAPATDKVKALALLGLGDVWVNADPSELARKVLDNAEAMAKAHPEQRNAIDNIVRRILGTGGEALFNRFFETGKGVEGYLSDADREMLTNRASRLGAVRPSEDVNAIKSVFGEGTSLFATTFMQRVDPSLQNLLSYIVAHREEISGAIRDFAKAMADFTKTLTSDAIPVLSFLFKGIQVGMEGFTALSETIHGGKSAAASVEKFSQDAANWLLPKWLQDWANEKGQFAPKVSGGDLNSASRFEINPYGAGGKYVFELNAEARRFFTIKRGTDNLDDATRKKMMQ